MKEMRTNAYRVIKMEEKIESTNIIKKITCKKSLAIYYLPNFEPDNNINTKCKNCYYHLFGPKSVYA